jgi:flagellar biosynthetic protein FliP
MSNKIHGFDDNLHASRQMNEVNLTGMNRASRNLSDSFYSSGGLRWFVLVLMLVLPMCLTQGIFAQATESSTNRTQVDNLDPANPISVLERVGRAIPLQPQDGTQVDSLGLSSSLSIIVLLTVLSIAPALVIMTTSFTRIVVVFALLRQAMGTQSLPPSQVIVGLSVFLTLLVMAPTFDRIHKECIIPMQNNELDQLTAWSRAKQPLRDFMFDQIEYAGNWGDVYMLLKYRGVDISQPETLRRADVDMVTLIPAFMLGELKTAFLIGFRLYLPFMIIDMVVASILISVGMMMLPPVMVSLPFKLLLFVLVNGWQLVTGNILSSFAVPGVTT